MRHQFRTTTALCIACTSVLLGHAAPAQRPQPKPPWVPPPPAIQIAEFSTISMTVAATPFKGQGRNASVAFAVELDASKLGLMEYNGSYRGRVNVRFVPTDAKNKVYPEVSHTASVQVRPGPSSRVPLEHIRVRVVSQLELRAGQYQVRVSAGSATAGGHSVYDLDVPDFRATPLVMSGVMLVSTSEPMVLALNTATGVGNTKEVTCQPPECKAPSSTDDGVMSLKSSVTEPMLRGGITGTPTATRAFKPGDEIVLVAEAYENRRRSNKPSVITLTTELRGTDGQVVPLGSEQQRVTDASK